MKKLFLLLFLLTSNIVSADEYDFELYTMKDTLYSMKKVRAVHKLVAVDFFSIHCKPCKEALPEWKKLYEKYKNKGMDMVLVILPVEDDRNAEYEKIEAFLQKNPLPFTVVFDKYSMVGKQYGVVESNGSAKIPQAFLLDKKGKLIISSEGHEKVCDKIKEMLK